MAGGPPSLTPARLRFSRRVLAEILAEARRAVPGECCGLLVGRDREVLRAIPAANLARRSGRFLIDPRDHVAARRAARREGLAVIGFYHSHPRGSAAPSRRDAAWAGQAGAFHLIVALAPDPPAWRVFQAGPDGLVETDFAVDG